MINCTNIFLDHPLFKLSFFFLFFFFFSLFLVLLSLQRVNRSVSPCIATFFTLNSKGELYLHKGGFERAVALVYFLLIDYFPSFFSISRAFHKHFCLEDSWCLSVKDFFSLRIYAPRVRYLKVEINRWKGENPQLLYRVEVRKKREREGGAGEERKKEKRGKEKSSVFQQNPRFAIWSMRYYS